MEWEKPPQNSEIQYFEIYLQFVVLINLVAIGLVLFSSFLN